MTDASRPRKLRYGMDAILAALGALILWSSAFAGISEVLTKGGYGPGEAALLRFLFASAAAGAIAVIRRAPLPRREDVPRLLAAALAGITVYHLAFTFGMTRVSAGAGALIISSGPLWTALMAVTLLRERFTWWGWAGVVLAFGGVAGIVLGEGRGGLEVELMALLVLVAAVATAVYFVLAKRPLRHYSSLDFTSYVIWLGTIPMLVFLPGLIAQAQHAPAWSTWTVAYLGVFPGALAYVLWSYALARMPASTTASFLYGQPVLATLVAWGWQGVIPGAVTLAGGALALVGVALVQAKGRPEPVVSVSVATAPEDRAAVLEMIGELIEHFGTVWEIDPAHRSMYAEEVEHFDEWYGGPVGRALIAKVDGQAAGCTVLRDDGDGAAEFRRMWVRPPFRRRGIARLLLRAAEDEARRVGYDSVRFMTSTELEGAVELYASEGYERIPFHRPVWSATAVAFGKKL